MFKTRISFALAAVLLAGCARHTAPAPSALTQTEQFRALCHASGTGVELRAAQVQAQQRPRPESFVAVGRQWVREARLKSDPGYYVNVDGCVELALAAEPGYVAALELRGLTLMNAHRFDEARVLAQQILAREPANVAALGTLSDALLELGRYAEATDAAQRQMNARPGMAAAARGSYLRWLVGDTRRAKILLGDALIGRDAADPEPTAWVLVEAGNLYRHQGDVDGADAVYREALKWVKEYPPALVGRARIALTRAQPETAIEMLKIAHQVRPAVESAWLLGDAYASRGDAGLARMAYDDAVRIGRRGDRLSLAQFYLAQGRDFEEALALIEAERAQRGGVYIDDAYALALFRNGRLDEARTVAERVVRVGTPDARLLHHAGMIYRACGERAAGNALLERALAVNPAFEAAREIREMLASGAAVARR